MRNTLRGQFEREGGVQSLTIDAVMKLRANGAHVAFAQIISWVALIAIEPKLLWMLTITLPGSVYPMTARLLCYRQFV